jgi:hypothetical protein
VLLDRGLSIDDICPACQFSLTTVRSDARSVARVMSQRVDSPRGDDTEMVIPGALQPAMNIVLLVSGLLVIGSWLLLVGVHIDDRYLVHRTEHVTDELQGGNPSVWMALARDTNAGRSYPIPYDGHVYAGTRYAPLVIYLWAGMARVTGEYLMSGKIITIVIAVLLLALVFRVIERLSRSRLAALALTSTVLVTIPGLVATAGTPRGDALALLLQLSAVTLLARSTRLPSCLGGAALCACAIASKISGAWAVMAIIVWLFGRDRRMLPVFLGAFSGFSLVAFLFFQVATGGRMYANFRLLLFADVGGGSALLAPLRLVELLGRAAPATSLLVPFALLGLGLAVAGRSTTIYHVSLICSLVVLTVVLADGGAQGNHLIDVVVLVPIVVAPLWTPGVQRSALYSLTSLAVGLSTLWGLALSYGLYLQHDVRDAAAQLVGKRGADAYRPAPLGAYVGPTDRLLSEDPYIPVSMAARPVVLDPFMVAVYERIRPDWVVDLERRVDAREFDKVVLAQRVETVEPVNRQIVFGEKVLSAICRSYRFEAEVLGYWIYVPAGDGQRPLSSAEATGPNYCIR